jgi:hypothetical protein
MSGMWGSTVLFTGHRLLSVLYPQIQPTWLTTQAFEAGLTA